MSRPFEVRQMETAYARQGPVFALELLDAVTLLRVSSGVEVVAVGLKNKMPIQNQSGLFIWREDPAPLQKITIDPRSLPYEGIEIPPDQLQLPPVRSPLTTVELPPRLDYPFAAGISGIRGTLVEVNNATPRVAVPNAQVRLRWLDDDGVTWHDAPTVSHTTDRGDFVSILRLAPTEAPHLDPNGEVTVRLWVRREDSSERQSNNFNLPQGRIADRSTLNTLNFSWDELQP